MTIDPLHGVDRRIGQSMIISHVSAARWETSQNSRFAPGSPRLRNFSIHPVDRLQYYASERGQTGIDSASINRKHIRIARTVFSNDEIIALKDAIFVVW